MEQKLKNLIKTLIKNVLYYLASIYSNSNSIYYLLHIVILVANSRYLIYFRSIIMK